ncbi:transient receptor potential cation channel subfamily V member 1 [Labrus bergylta]|uniref:Transient receptor potential cation channel, subfamily V, member 1 n=1 Tax=Labrus bergylta TaxID=56723 RepID=A0A3Q3FPB5_9LABR|nr:transient receptor potential cation channel subfamily V member 1-like [Labrus bergylta]XP_020505607.1 transient receptor potential cation channel subfamily V member 1-like [Labrus bergylta]
MKKSDMFSFELETDNRTAEEYERDKAERKDGGASSIFGPKSPKAPMDTDYQEEMEKTRPQLRFKIGSGLVDTGEGNSSGEEVERFTRERLFEAAASRDVSRLDGLHLYLHQKMMKLSDSLYQSYGKTALMKALLHLRDGKNETVELMIEVSEKIGDVEKFVNAAYTNNYYKGQTALHIAIERRSLSYVKLLVSKGADVHTKACGTFFQPHDGPNFYFGELPLSLAACTNQPDLVNFLMLNEYKRVKPEVKDSHGNTVLHALVVVAAENYKENTEFIINMYDFILKTAASLYPKLKLENIKNNKGLTPLKLAAKTGKIGIFSHILKREFDESHTKHLSRKFTQWVYGPVTSSLYDLASVDSYEDNSVVEILVYGNGIPNRHEMLQTEPLSRLMESKWKKFAGGMFFFNFLFYLLYLIIFTLVAYNKKSDKELPFRIEYNTMGYLYVSGQLVTALSNCYFFITGIMDMWMKRPKMQSLLVDGYYEILFLVQGALFLVASGLYLSKRPEYLGFLVLCLALSWVNLLYFSRGDKHMGVYSIMIQKMILSDIMRFLFVYAVFLFGFSAAVVTLLIKPEEKNTTTVAPGRGRLYGPLDDNELCLKPTFASISYTTLQLFKFTIGMGDMEFTQDYQYIEVFYILLIAYIILTYILLLNMLIALMNRTVEKTTMESDSIWKLQRAITILDMEKRLPRCMRKWLRCGVDINLGKNIEDGCRRCFRVEEVNWNKWNINLGIINEEPGWDQAQQPASDTSHRAHRAHRGRSFRGFFSDGSRRWRTYQSTEMNPLSSTPI